MTGPKLVEAVCACGARLPGVPLAALEAGTVVHLTCRLRNFAKKPPAYTPAS